MGERPSVGLDTHWCALPIDQPTKFTLTVNLKSARALGITISESILLRSDEVIQ
jgi:putative ABC transport system substrate-binding protein